MAVATTFATIANEFIARPHQSANRQTAATAVSVACGGSDKGPKYPLPAGHSFEDKDGTPRDAVRLQWWNAEARTWRDIAMSVPEPDDLPITIALAENLIARSYPLHERPVFFGHYWLHGKLRLQAANAVYLDHSAGEDGCPLVT